VPKQDPQHWYLFSESITEDLVSEHAEIHGFLVDVIGGYDRFVHIIYEPDDPNTENLRILNGLGVRNGRLDSAADLHELKSCLSGFIAFGRDDGRHHHSLCVQHNPLTDPRKASRWDGDAAARYGMYHGWVHEYFHHYQRAHAFDRSMGMPGECCGLRNPIGAPAWWVEGTANAFPHVFMKEYFDRFTYTVENGHRFDGDDEASGWIRSAINDHWDWFYGEAKREAMGLEPGCEAASPAEEYRDTKTCDWFLMNVYLAYLTSWQVVWVDLPADMWALDFDGSFAKHVGMSVDEFYESYNAFMRSGDPDDPAPDGFFPDRPLAELVDFWAIESG